MNFFYNLLFTSRILSSFFFGADADDSSHKSSGSAKSSNTNEGRLYDKVYEDGTRRVENLSETGHYYSDGTESWNGMLGEEHRSNGEVIHENAYISGKRDIYDKNGKYIGYEYEDSLGVTHRVDG